MHQSVLDTRETRLEMVCTHVQRRDSENIEGKIVMAREEEDLEWVGLRNIFLRSL